MKNFFYAFLLLCPALSFGQSGKTTTFQLIAGDCKPNGINFWRGSDTIALYKLPGNTLAYTITPKTYNHWPLQIDNVQTGQYKLIYQNNFEQDVTEQITLAEQSVNTITICPDKLLAYPQNTLVKLQNREAISIMYQSQGCFSSSVLKLTITKENGKLIARLHNISPAHVGEHGTIVKESVKDTLKTATMTDQNIEDFVKFENELNHTRSLGCTTTDWYEIKSKYLNLQKTDGSCSWNGIAYLKKALFGIEE